MIDEKGRLFGKVSIIDILIVAAAAVCAVYFLWPRAQAAAPVQANTEVYTLTYTTTAAPDFVATVVNAGDKLEDAIKGGELGKVTKIELSEGYDVKPDRNGVLQKSFKEGYTHIYMETEVTGQMSENGIVINGNAYKIGQSVTLRAGIGKLFIVLSGIEPKGGL